MPVRSIKDNSLQQLGEGVMDVVLTAAGRRLSQVLEMIHEEYIVPRDKRISELEAEVYRLKQTSGG